MELPGRVWGRDANKNHYQLQTWRLSPECKPTIGRGGWRRHRLLTAASHRVHYGGYFVDEALEELESANEVRLRFNKPERLQEIVATARFAGSIPVYRSVTLASASTHARARVAELVDAADLKSAVRKDVPVRVRPRAPVTAIANSD